MVMTRDDITIPVCMIGRSHGQTLAELLPSSINLGPANVVARLQHLIPAELLVRNDRFSRHWP